GYDTQEELWDRRLLASGDCCSRRSDHGGSVRAVDLVNLGPGSGCAGTEADDRRRAPVWTAAGDLGDDDHVQSGDVGAGKEGGCCRALVFLHPDHHRAVPAPDRRAPGHTQGTCRRAVVWVEATQHVVTHPELSRGVVTSPGVVPD